MALFPIPAFMYSICERLYIPRIPAYLAAAKIGRSILGIYKSLTDMYMNVDIGRQNIIILFWKQGCE
jgi:hypothetical protein